MGKIINMKYLLTGCLCISSHFFFAQQNIQGQVISENGTAISGATVYNLSSYQITNTDRSGKFIIAAKKGEKIRVSKEGFDRTTVSLTTENNSDLVIRLIKTATEIEEVKLKYKPTGDLSKDSKHFDKNKKNKKLDENMGQYIAKKSSPSVTAPRHGEFVQPVGPGTSVTLWIENKWTDVDLYEFLVKNIDNDFFTVEMKLKNQEIMPFIFYIFKSYERKTILKYGVLTETDRARFLQEAYKIQPYYKNGKENPFSTKKMKK